jgi:exopolysaccharide biosynthesis polyprenyl glycosylphosphotransferase
LTSATLAAAPGYRAAIAHRTDSNAGWARRHIRTLLIADCTSVALAVTLALGLRFGVGNAAPVSGSGVPYTLVTVLAIPVWMAALALNRCYDHRLLGQGSGELRRVFMGSFRLAGLVAIASYLGRLELARGYLAIAVPAGTLLLLAGRAAVRLHVAELRKRGEFLHRVVVIGDAGHASDFVRMLAKAPQAGYDVVGVCLPGRGVDEVGGVPVIGSITTAVEAAVAAGADTIAVTASSSVSSDSLRRLAWELEGSGINLVVAPALTDVAGPRIHITPIAGLPLLQITEPELGLVHRSVKAVFDKTLAVGVLLFVAPVIAALALAVKVSSPGPAFFRQERVGRDGETFRIWKLRTMRSDAESMLKELKQRNESDGLLFKMRADPRVTRVGTWLRRYSLDELPQLINVVRGDMSLVGPRPPLASEVALYASDVERRLMVKPGITGLWQVSGRSDLSWDDSVRLDLYYVENWSLALDLSIIARTALAVVKSSGAY